MGDVSGEITAEAPYSSTWFWLNNEAELPIR